MPYRPATPCRYPGCPELTHERYCPEHRGQVRPDDRPGSTARGYGSRWQTVRRMFLRREPLCELCGDTATVAHHKVEKKDGGRDNFENLQALCAVCHNRVHRGGAGQK
jgi:5-methylcytosine-specific restriction enzyme A